MDGERGTGMPPEKRTGFDRGPTPQVPPRPSAAPHGTPGMHGAYGVPAADDPDWTGTAETGPATATAERERLRARRGHVDLRHESHESSVPGLLRGLARDTVDLVRQEAALARSELGEKVEQLRSGAIELGSGALVLHAGILVLLAAAVFGLDEVLDRPWLSALIVGGVVTLVGLLLLGRGRSNVKAQNLTLERTERSLKKDADMVRDETRRART